MKKIIAFAGSNSKTSINKQLVTYASTLLEDVEVTVLDLNDFELPIYGIDIENEQGIPELAHQFVNHIKTSEGIIVSLAEHNGVYTTAFKNIFDWISRVEQKCFCNKPMLLMATSPGNRGGLGVLEIAKDRFPRHNATIVETFSLSFFSKNFENGKIIDDNLNHQLETKAAKFLKVVNS